MKVRSLVGSLIVRADAFRPKSVPLSGDSEDIFVEKVK